MTSLDRAHVLVTGGSSGIGLATARAALARNASVSLVARDPERLATAADELEAWVGDPARVAVANADVADPAALGRAVDVLVAQLGPVDVLVTSAGFSHPGLFLELEAGVFEQQMARQLLRDAAHDPGRRAGDDRAAARAPGARLVDRRVPRRLRLLARTHRRSSRSGASPRRCAGELKPHGIVVACAYPPDTDTPGLAAENELEARGDRADLGDDQGPRSAEAVAGAIVEGIERDRLVITADRPDGGARPGRGSARAVSSGARWTATCGARRSES